MLRTFATITTRANHEMSPALHQVVRAIAEREAGEGDEARRDRDFIFRLFDHVIRQGVLTVLEFLLKGIE